MKKKRIANLIMVAIIVVIAVAGVLGVGMVQGWFDHADGSQALLTNIRGIVNIERDGVSYAVEDDTVLRTGDKITCSPGATVMIQTADGYFMLANSADMEITDPASDSFSAKVTSGEVFANTTTTAKLTLDSQQVELTDTVALLSVRSGAQTVSVFAGTVGDAQSGQTMEWVNGEKRVDTLAIRSLNDFAIAQLRAVDERVTLCFTGADLDELEAGRKAQLQEQMDPAKPSEPVDTQPPETIVDPEPSTMTEPSQETTEPAETEPVETEPAETEPAETDPPAPTYDGYVTISIRCDTILNNWDNLDPAKAPYVPSDGWILYAEVGFNEGETVFDVLVRACSDYGIQIEYSWTPMYNSYYIEGIHHLYEFDCGSESGWMYKVNGWFPNYGCSAYTVSDGDNIVWTYTCNGLGADVGA